MRHTFDREFSTASRPSYSTGRRLEDAKCGAVSALRRTRYANSSWRQAVKRLVLIVSIGLLLAAGASGSLAQSGGGYDLAWSVISSGGQSSSGGAFSLNGTIGQADAGAMIGGRYTLGGGFWSGTPAVHRMFLPLTLK